MTGFVNRALNFNDNIMSNLIDGNWVLGYNVKISHFSVKFPNFICLSLQIPKTIKVQYQVKYWDFIVFQILMLQFKVLHNIDITINQNVNNHRNIIILNSIYLKVSQIPMQLSFEFVWQAGFSIHNFYCYSAYVLHLFELKSL